MEDREKVTFNIEDFDEIWENELKEADAIDKNKITPTDRAFARGFYSACDYLENAILNAIDEVEIETDTLNKIKTEIIEDAGEKIKENMESTFYEVITSILESHAE